MAVKPSPDPVEKACSLAGIGTGADAPAARGGGDDDGGGGRRGGGRRLVPGRTGRGQKNGGVHVSQPRNGEMGPWPAAELGVGAGRARPVRIRFGTLLRRRPYGGRGR